MKQSLGLVEISGLSTAVLVADTMVKSANVQIIEMENAKGLGYMTIKIQGDVGAVKAAVDAGCKIGSTYGKLVSCKVIPRPSDYVEKTFGSPIVPAPSALPVPSEPVEVPETAKKPKEKPKEEPKEEPKEQEQAKAVKKPVSGTAKKATKKASRDKGDN